jgi:hypothetical protein
MNLADDRRWMSLMSAITDLAGEPTPKSANPQRSEHPDNPGA